MFLFCVVSKIFILDLFSQLTPLSWKDHEQREVPVAILNENPVSVAPMRRDSLTSAQYLTECPLTLLPRKRVHSLSVELLNAFVCICPGSRDLGENRITLKGMPAHGLALWEQPKEAWKWTEECCHLRISSSYCSPKERSLPLFQTEASQILCALRRAVIRLFLSKVETRNSCIEEKKRKRKTGSGQVGFAAV